MKRGTKKNLFFLLFLPCQCTLLVSQTMDFSCIPILSLLSNLWQTTCFFFFPQTVVAQKMLTNE